MRSASLASARSRWSGKRIPASLSTTRSPGSPRDQVNDIVERWAREGLNDQIRDKTGLPNDSWFCASKIAWILENVEGARERAERGELFAGTVDTWLIWKLTGGERFVTDYSNASHTMFFNIHALQWDEELCDAFGIPVHMLPEVVPSDAHFGTTGETFDAEIPIRAVLGDQMAGLFGQTCYEPGLAKNTYGTAGVYNVNTGAEPAYREGLLTSIAWGLNGEVTYETEAVVFSGGATIQWLRDAMKMIESAPESEWYSSQVPDTQGVYLVPAFNGLVSPHYDMYARAIICGMSNSTNRNHVIRAGLESIAYQTRDLVEAVTSPEEISTCTSCGWTEEQLKTTCCASFSQIFSGCRSYDPRQLRLRCSAWHTWPVSPVIFGRMRKNYLACGRKIAYSNPR